VLEVALPAALFEGICRAGVSVMQDATIEALTLPMKGGICVEAVLIQP
jgi:hypothetical protein